MAGVFFTKPFSLRERSKTKALQTRHYFRLSVENCSKYQHKMYRVSENLREVFADKRTFVFCRNYFLRLEKTHFSCWGLIFAIFRKTVVCLEL